MKGLYQSVTLKNISFHGFWLFQTLRYHRTNRPFNWCVCLIVVWKIIIKLVLLLCFARRCFLLLLYIFFMVLALQLPGAAPGIKDEVLVIFRGSLENNWQSKNVPFSQQSCRIMSSDGSWRPRLSAPPSLDVWLCGICFIGVPLTKTLLPCCSVRSAPACRWDSEQRILIFHSVLPGPIISRLTSARVPRQMQVCLTSWSLWKRNIVAVLGTNGDLQ